MERIAEPPMQMVSDRNLTVHTYREEPAIQLYGRLARYAGLLHLWLTEIQKRIE